MNDDVSESEDESKHRGQATAGANLTRAKGVAIRKVSWKGRMKPAYG